MSLLDYLRKPYIMIPIAAAGAAMAIAGAKKAAPTIDDVLAKVVPDVSVERLVGDGVAWAGENYNHIIEPFVKYLDDDHFVKKKTYEDDNGRTVQIDIFNIDKRYILRYSHNNKVYGFRIVKGEQIVDKDGDGTYETLANTIHDFRAPSWTWNS